MDDHDLPFVVTEDTDPSRSHEFEHSQAAKAKSMYTLGSFRVLVKFYSVLSSIAVALAISEFIIREPALSFLAMLASAAAAVSFFIFLYRSWRQLQEGETLATARESVGFLFVPVFNIYWAFVAFSGLTQQLNECLQAMGKDHRVNESIGTVMSALSALFLLVFQFCGMNTQRQIVDTQDYTDPGLWIVLLCLLSLWGFSIAFVISTARASELIAASTD